MKIDLRAVVQAVVIALLLFISGKVWEAVEIAKENKVRIEHIREDLDQLWANTSELSAVTLREGHPTDDPSLPAEDPSQ
jgi:hypothetical protein